jgi:Holliday junction resolvase
VNSSTTTSSQISAGLRFELQVKRLLEQHGFTVLKRGKGVDLIAINRSSILFIECKNYQQTITGKTLTKIVRKLNKSVNRFLSDPYYSYLTNGKQIFKVIISRNCISKRYGRLIFTFEEFKKFLEVMVC